MELLHLSNMEVSKLLQGCKLLGVRNHQDNEKREWIMSTVQDRLILVAVIVFIYLFLALSYISCVVYLTGIRLLHYKFDSVYSVFITEY